MTRCVAIAVALCLPVAGAAQTTVNPPPGCDTSGATCPGVPWK